MAKSKFINFLDAKSKNYLKLPIVPSLIFIAITIVGIIGYICYLMSDKSLIEATGSFALIITFDVLLYYTYYTYLIAKDNWTPCASFNIFMPKEQYSDVLFELQNHSKMAIQCWCNLNVTVYGKPLELDVPFYSGKKSFDLQPLGSSRGHFSIGDILTKSGQTGTSLKENRTIDNEKSQIYMDIEFWYKSYDRDEIIRNPKQPHYYDVSRNTLVMDF